MSEEIQPQIPPPPPPPPSQPNQVNNVQHTIEFNDILEMVKRIYDQKIVSESESESDEVDTKFPY